MDNNFKLPDNLPKFDINTIPKDLFKDGNTINNLLKNQANPFSDVPVQTPDFLHIKLKKEPKPKKGIEALYEKHVGKITLILAGIAIVEALIIFLLS